MNEGKEQRGISCVRPSNGHVGCQCLVMEPSPLSAIAVQWEFRCLGRAMHAKPWHWRCRSGDGVIVAESDATFETLHEAVADANKHGFGYAVNTEAR